MIVLIARPSDATNTPMVVDVAAQRPAASACDGLIAHSHDDGKCPAIYPEREGKQNGVAIRVALLSASLTDRMFEVSRPTTGGAVNALMKAAADGPLKGSQIRGAASRLGRRSTERHRRCGCRRWSWMAP